MGKSYAQFFETHNGKGWNPDGAYSYQCMDLWIEWFNYVFGYNPPPQASAYMVWTNRNYIFANMMEKVSFLEEDPRVGDVVVYAANIPNFTGSNGHIAIFDHAPMNLFTQNFACNNLDGNGYPLCPAEVKNHGSSKPLGYIRFNVIKENNNEPIQLSPTEGLVLGVTNVRAKPTRESGIVGELIEDTIVKTSGKVIGEDVDGKNEWISALGGYISITRFSQLPSELPEVTVSANDPVEYQPDTSQPNISSIKMATTKDLEGIRARTTPVLDHTNTNVFRLISGAQSFKLICEVDGDEYEGSTKWINIEYPYKTENGEDAVISLYVHSAFIEGY